MGQCRSHKQSVLQRLDKLGISPEDYFKKSFCELGSEDSQQSSEQVKVTIIPKDKSHPQEKEKHARSLQNGAKKQPKFPNELNSGYLDQCLNPELQKTQLDNGEKIARMAGINHPFELYHHCHSELDVRDALSEWLLMTTQQKARYHQEYEDQLKVFLKKSIQAGKEEAAFSSSRADKDVSSSLAHAKDDGANSALVAAKLKETAMQVLEKIDRENGPTVPAESVRTKRKYVKKADKEAAATKQAELIPVPKAKLSESSSSSSSSDSTDKKESKTKQEQEARKESRTISEANSSSEDVNWAPEKKRKRLD